jgi:hypothetical protein
VALMHAEMLRVYHHAGVTRACRTQMGAMNERDALQHRFHAPTADARVVAKYVSPLRALKIVVDNLRATVITDERTKRNSISVSSSTSRALLHVPYSNIRFQPHRRRRMRRALPVLRATGRERSQHRWSNK